MHGKSACLFSVYITPMPAPTDLTTLLCRCRCRNFGSSVFCCVYWSIDTSSDKSVWRCE